MRSSSHELLRQLLPRYFWLRDAELGGGVLDALVRGIALEYDELRLDVARLYDDLFIATCDPRYVPLIGDGIGVMGLAPVLGPGVGDRAWVGRVVGLRRRKGMLATVARGASAATGWAAYVQEGRSVVSMTRSMLYSAGATKLANISGRKPVAPPSDPWSQLTCGVSISGRPIVAGEPAASAPTIAAGYPAPDNVALSIWRLQSFPVSRRTAVPAVDAPRHHAGRAFRCDPLGRDTRLFAICTRVGDRRGMPRPLELPLPLTNALLAEALRASGPGRPPPVRLHGCDRLLPGDLRHWRRPAGSEHADAIIDPLRGRLLLLGEPRASLEVSYAYGFPGELGGGPYGSAADYAVAPPGTARIHVARARTDARHSIESALAAVDGHDAVIVVDDSATYSGRWELTVPPDRELRVASAPEAAPVLAGDMHARIHRGGRLELSGLTISGTLTVAGDGELAIEHCTLAPRKTKPSIDATGAIAITLAYAVSGRVDANSSVHVAARASIIDGPLVGEGTLDLEHVTLLGAVDARTLIAADCLFTSPVQAGDGLVRTSYIPAGSRVPQLFECKGPATGQPRFVSTRWGDPGYCQLHLRCPTAIAAGGSRGGELGAYNWLGQPERYARLPAVLQELLPAGIGASVRYLT